jgi:hypothetical protein
LQSVDTTATIFPDEQNESHRSAQMVTKPTQRRSQICMSAITHSQICFTSAERAVALVDAMTPMDQRASGKVADVAWHATDRVSIEAGYRHLDIDYDHRDIAKKAVPGRNIKKVRGAMMRETTIGTGIRTKILVRSEEGPPCKFLPPRAYTTKVV